MAGRMPLRFRHLVHRIQSGLDRLGVQVKHVPKPGAHVGRRFRLAGFSHRLTLKTLTPALLASICWLMPHRSLVSRNWALDKVISFSHRDCPHLSVPNVLCLKCLLRRAPHASGDDPIKDLGFVVFPTLVGIVAGVFHRPFHYPLRRKASWHSSAFFVRGRRYWLVPEIWM